MAQFKQPHLSLLTTLPQELKKTAVDIINAATRQSNKRYSQQNHKGILEVSLYEAAKVAETV
jgi:hypothetical protein